MRRDDQFPHNQKSERDLYWTRRHCLQVGGISLLGLNLPVLSTLKTLQASEGSHIDLAKREFRSCIFVFLFGGPSQLDLWDMKPAAPLEIRGDFNPIQTNVAGIEVCEHLPLLAQQADKYCLLRSMTHNMNVHGPACSEIYSGREYFGPPVTDQAKPEDWPSLSAMVTRFGKTNSGLPPASVLPWYTQFVGQDKRIAGQTGGRMGDKWNPYLIQGDMSQPDFHVQGVELPAEVTQKRFAERQQLWAKLNQLSTRRMGKVKQLELMQQNYESAWKLVSNAADNDVFSIQQESEKLRDQYGRSKFGQSLLMARRLVEKGISLVTVNWDDDSKNDKVSPHWDTHHHNFNKLKNNLCPVFDRGMAALFEDLAERGMLESTLVVAVGEFGRTPRVGLVTQNGMTEPTGRDHWPHAFTAMLAGGGVRGGQVYGATNKSAGYVDENPVTPADLSSTILHHLGIDPHLTYHDEFQQEERVLSVGNVVRGLS